MINYMQNQTNSVAYVWEDRMASVHVTISEYFAPVGELSAMRVAAEPLCKLFHRLCFSQKNPLSTLSRLRIVFWSSGKSFTL